MLKTATACLVAALAAVPAFAQSGDRPTATGAGSTTGGSPSMRPGTASDQTVTSPANPATSSMGAPTSTAAPSTTGAPMTPGSNAATSGSSGGVMSSGPTAPAGSSPSAMSSGAMSSGGAMPAGSAASTSGSFIAKQQTGQMLASSLIGTTVVSQGNETIGDVNDLLFDRNGQVTAAVIGVGGFLGIGEKDVAVSFGQLEFVAEPAATVAPTGAAVPSAAGTAANSVPATTASTAVSAAPADTMPSRVMLRMSKADLQAAPTFEQYSRAAAQGMSGSGVVGTTPAPRQ